MDKAAIRAKAKELCHLVQPMRQENAIEAALIQVHNAAVEACRDLVNDDPICDWEDGDREVLWELMSRLRIEKVVKEG